MKAYLLDVNVLLALFWSSQESHKAAQAWFGSTGHKRWATNPITQVGLVRLLTNPAITGKSVAAQSALDVLEKNLSHPGHEFWPLDSSIVPFLLPLAPKLCGHRQWTDALLLAEAARHDGILVTFDAGLNPLAAGKLAGHLLVLKSKT